TLFLPYIETRDDNGTYTIPLDIHYQNQEDKSEKSEDTESSEEFDGSVIVIKIIPQIVKDINSPLLNNFLKSYDKYHKIIVFNGKKGMIMRILRPSINNSTEVAFRKIIDAKAVFK